MIPREQVIEQGGTLRLKCISTDQPNWLKDGFFVVSGGTISQTNYTLKINQVSERDSGQYECQGILPNGKKFKSSATVYVGGI